MTIFKSPQLVDCNSYRELFTSLFNKHVHALVILLLLSNFGLEGTQIFFCNIYTFRNRYYFSGFLLSFKACECKTMN